MGCRLWDAGCARYVDFCRGLMRCLVFRSMKGDK